MNPEEFRRVIGNALSFTEKSDAIVTIGIKPSRPETGYGYVEAADAVSGEIKKVAAFKEKPSREVAEQYVTAGNYLWNAGILVWNVRTITEAIKTYKPNIASDMDKIVGNSQLTVDSDSQSCGGQLPTTNHKLQTIFPQCEKISIDYAVMEPAAADGKVYTHPADFGWSDLGNWASLHDKLQKDSAGNGAVGKVHLYECSNCVVHAEEASKVVLQGLDGYIVSAKGDRLLVCKRSEEQRIKEFSQQ